MTESLPPDDSESPEDTLARLSDPVATGQLAETEADVQSGNTLEDAVEDLDLSVRELWAVASAARALRTALDETDVDAALDERDELGRRLAGVDRLQGRLAGHDLIGDLEHERAKEREREDRRGY